MLVEPYGIPMNSGGWYRWSDVDMVGKEALYIRHLPDTMPFCLQNGCSLARIGDFDKERCQFVALLAKDQSKRRTRIERYRQTCGIGEPLISDECIRAELAKARAKVACVSECIPALALLAVEVVAATAEDEEAPSKDASKLCRMINTWDIFVWW